MTEKKRKKRSDVDLTDVTFEQVLGASGDSSNEE